MRANRRCSPYKNIGHDKRKCPLNIPPQSTSLSTSPPVLSELPSVLRNNFTAFPNSPTSQRCLLLPRNSSPRLNLHHQSLSAQTITTTIPPIGTPNSIGTIDAPLAPLSVQGTAITDDTGPHANGYIPFSPCRGISSCSYCIFIYISRRLAEGFFADIDSSTLVV